MSQDFHEEQTHRSTPPSSAAGGHAAVWSHSPLCLQDDTSYSGTCPSVTPSRATALSYSSLKNQHLRSARPWKVQLTQNETRCWGWSPRGRRASRDLCPGCQRREAKTTPLRGPSLDQHEGDGADGTEGKLREAAGLGQRGKWGKGTRKGQVETGGDGETRTTYLGFRAVKIH